MAPNGRTRHLTNRQFKVNLTLLHQRENRASPHPHLFARQAKVLTPRNQLQVIRRRSRLPRCITVTSSYVFHEFSAPTTTPSGFALLIPTLPSNHRKGAIRPRDHTRHRQARRTIRINRNVHPRPPHLNNRPPCTTRQVINTLSVSIRGASIRIHRGNPRRQSHNGHSLRVKVYPLRNPRHVHRRHRIPRHQNPMRSRVAQGLLAFSSRGRPNSAPSRCAFSSIYESSYAYNPPQYPQSTLQSLSGSPPTTPTTHQTSSNAPHNKHHPRQCTPSHEPYNGS